MFSLCAIQTYLNYLESTMLFPTPKLKHIEIKFRFSNETFLVDTQVRTFFLNNNLVIYIMQKSVNKKKYWDEERFK